MAVNMPPMEIEEPARLGAPALPELGAREARRLEGALAKAVQGAIEKNRVAAEMGGRDMGGRDYGQVAIEERFDAFGVACVAGLCVLAAPARPRLPQEGLRVWLVAHFSMEGAPAGQEWIVDVELGFGVHEQSEQIAAKFWREGVAEAIADMRASAGFQAEAERNVFRAELAPGTAAAPSRMAL